MNPELPANDRFVDRLGRNAALDAPADAIQPIVRRLFESAGVLGTPVKNALHGTWLGHSLHPIITDVPIGAWTVGAVCDTLDLLGFDGYGDAADIAIAIGSLAAFGAAITGWADWSDTSDAPKRVGIVHAAGNGIALTTYLASLALRGRGQRGAARALALAAYGLVGASAYLGGELSTGMQLGVKHTAAPLAPPDDFVDVCGEYEVAENAMKRADLDGIPILLSRSGKSIFAVAAVCTHRGAPLEEGALEDGCVRCPWHQGLFDLHDGTVREGPPTFPLATFETRLWNGRIQARRSRA